MNFLQSGIWLGEKYTSLAKYFNFIIGKVGRATPIFKSCRFIKLVSCQFWISVSVPVLGHDCCRFNWMIRHLREPMAFLQKLNSWFPPNDESYREMPLSPGDLLFFQSSNCKMCLGVVLLNSPDKKLSYWRAAQYRKETHWVMALAGILESISFKAPILQRRKDRPSQRSWHPGPLASLSNPHETITETITET